MNSSNTNSETPTVDFELLITRDSEKALSIAYEPMRREVSVLEACVLRVARWLSGKNI